MNKYYLGVDLGSTTSKAVIIDEHDKIIGRGITNTRANYKVAADIARLEATFDARFNILENKLSKEIKENPKSKKYIEELKSVFKYLQFHKRLKSLHSQLKKTVVESFNGKNKETISRNVDEIVNTIEPKIKDEFLNGNLGNKNQFFRDIISEKYNEHIEIFSKEYFEPLMLVFDKSITPVENEMVEYDFQELVHNSISILNGKYEKAQDIKDENKSTHFDAELNLLTGNFNSISESLKEHIEQIAKMEIHIANMVGTGYGRALLPFAEDCIKSEILCHAFGAHAIFPDTRTVLDIGGTGYKSNSG